MLSDFWKRFAWKSKNVPLAQIYAEEAHLVVAFQHTFNLTKLITVDKKPL